MIYAQLHVIDVEHVTPQMRRVTLGGLDLAGFAPVAPDQQCKLFFARDGGVPAVPAPEADGDVIRWYGRYLAVPEPDRPWMRSYTIRRHHPQRREIEIDFVLHGPGGGDGPASRWAAQARPGQVVGMYGPAVSHVRAPREHATGSCWSASMVRAVRRHLVGERGIAKRDIAFTGYWRLHLTQDDDPTAEDEADQAEIVAAMEASAAGS